MTTAIPQPLRRLLSPVERLLETESASAVVLITSALIAFALANSPLAEIYHTVQHAPLALSLAGHTFELSVAHWVNDGLMAVFFFYVGLEIKREVLQGELAGWQRASLPVAGALGGMIAPALIYVSFTAGTPLVDGWGVPMATDIAFAVGVLGLLGNRVPLTLKVFLLALAIVDDLGAVLVIALFYTADLNLTWLALCGAAWLGALAYGWRGGGNAGWFLAFGVAMWIAMHESGVHATVAGVLLALAVPVFRGLGEQELKQELAAELGGHAFEELEVRLEHLERVIDRARSPLHDFEHDLGPWVAWLIMPLFAFLNAGVSLAPSGDQPLVGTVTFAVAFGLVLGKPIGIAGSVALMRLFGLASFPPGVSWMGYVGIGLLAGIGFTMAIFIANLAFQNGSLLDQAKLGILIGSLIAAVAGFICLRLVLNDDQRTR